MRPVHAWRRNDSGPFELGRSARAERLPGIGLLAQRYGRGNRVGSAHPIDPRERWVIRSYHSQDLADVLRLYREGVVATGADDKPAEPPVDPFDTAADLDDIAQAYLQSVRDHFWVAEVDGRVVGMVGVMADGASLVEIRRLRVDPAWKQSELASALVRKALLHCRRQGFLKVVFDTHVEADEAMRLCEKHGFLHTRSKRIRGKDVLEFYLDLYHRTPADRGERWSFV